MELRHLRCFLAVAEELHFARAAERLHIEQSPLSRAIKELEEDLGVVLFARTTRSTRLTHAGALFLEHARRVLTALEQARDSVKAAANGFHGQLRVALSDGVTPSRLSALLALCRQEEPEVEIRFFEVPLSQLLKGLQDDLYDVGFAQSNEVGDGIVAVPAWSDALMVAVPARHPLLAHKRIPLDELLRYPLVLCDPQVCEGHAKHIERVLRRADIEPLVAERVASCDLMMALVSGGIALGLTGAAHIAMSDGYEVYNGIAKAAGLTHLGCWVHARRPFIKAEEAIPRAVRSQDQIASRFVRLIGKLYRAEALAKD